MRLTKKENNMKKIITFAAVAAMTIATPVFAGTLTGEARFGDVRGGKNTDSTELKVEYWDSIVGKIVAGAELQAKQYENAGSLSSAFSFKGGYVLPKFLNVETTAYSELGESFKLHNNQDFWGLGVKGSYPVFGPLSLTSGYRHRQGFDSSVGSKMNEERLNAGVSYGIMPGTSLGTNFYRTSGSTNSDTVGVSISHKF